jgi:hypothetical protein
MAMPHHNNLTSTSKLTILMASLLVTKPTLTPPITRQCDLKQDHHLALTWLYGNGFR